MPNEHTTKFPGLHPEILEAEAPQKWWPDRATVPNGIAISVLSVITLIIWLPRLWSPIDIRWDAGTYYVLGTSLAHGTGYRLLNEPGDIQATQYPPLIPLIIAAHQLLLQTNDYAVVGHWLKVTWLVFLLSFVTGTYVWLKLYVPQVWAFTGALFCLLNFQVYFFSGLCTADLPFALASLGFLLIYRNDGGAARGVAAGAAAIASFLARSVGVALFIAWIADAALRGEIRRTATRSVIAGLCILGWQGYIRSVESSPEYTKTAYSYQRAAYQFYNVSYARNMAFIDPFRPELGQASRRDLFARFMQNAEVLPVRVMEPISSQKASWVQQTNALFPILAINNRSDKPVTALMAVISTLIAGGFVLLLLDKEWAIVIYTIVSIVAICATPWHHQMPRYFMPLTPIFALALFSVLRWAIEWTHNSRVVQCAAVVLVTCLLVEQVSTYIFVHHFHFSTGQIRDTRNRLVRFQYLYYFKAEAGLDDCLMWISHHAKPSDIVATTLPQRPYILTDLKTVMPPREIDPNKANLLLDTVPVRYLLLQNDVEPTDNTRPYMLRMVRSFPDRWRVVYGSQDVQVYERVRAQL